MTVACRAGGAPIIWAVTVGNGRRIPVDEKPTKRAVLRKVGEVTECKIVDTYVPHWATCPRATEFRGQNDRAKKRLAPTESVRLLKVLSLSTQRLEKCNHKLQLVAWRLSRVTEKGAKRVR